MSAIDFGVDHRFFPAGRRPDELGVGFLVVNPISPNDFIKLSHVPPSIKTETLNPKEGLGSSKRNTVDAHLEHFLKIHYSIDIQKTGQVSGVKLVTERVNNVSSASLKPMLSTPEAIGFLKQISEERAQRSKVKAWASHFFHMDPWLVVSTHTFYESSVSISNAETASVEGEVTVPITEALASNPAGLGDPGAGASTSSTASTTKEGQSLQPLVFAAKFRQIRYKLKDDQLFKCYLLEDRPVKLGFFGSKDKSEDKDPIKSVNDLMSAIQEGKVDIECKTDEEGLFSEFVDEDETMNLDGNSYRKGN